MKEEPPEDNVIHIFARLHLSSSVSQVLHIYRSDTQKTLCGKSSSTYAAELPSDGVRGCRSCWKILQKNRNVPWLHQIKKNTEDWIEQRKSKD